MTDPDRRHNPVLLNRCIELLSPALQTDGAVLVDATVGMGGHSAGLLEACPTARLVGIDRDPDALRLARRHLAEHGERVTLVHAVYDELSDILRSLGISSVQGILMDLGVSSLQLDEADRGFSYARSAPLDMRMDPTTGQSAAELLAVASEREIAKILKTYGEERYAGRIARRIVERRTREPLSNSLQLVDVVRSAIPAAARREGGNPAKRTFQALRIAVNDELGALERCLPQALSWTAVGGRVVVEAYQSLEDRLVKSSFVRACNDRAPLELPVVPDNLRAEFASLTRGAELADEKETELNPRAMSVRLRGVQRLRKPGTAENGHTARSMGGPRR